MSSRLQGCEKQTKCLPPFCLFVVVDVVFAMMPWPSDLISFYGCGFGEKRYQLWQNENG